MPWLTTGPNWQREWASGNDRKPLDFERLLPVAIKYTIRITPFGTECTWASERSDKDDWVQGQTVHLLHNSHGDGRLHQSSLLTSHCNYINYVYVHNTGVLARIVHQHKSSSSSARDSDIVAPESDRQTTRTLSGVLLDGPQTFWLPSHCCHLAVTQLQVKHVSDNSIICML